MIAFRNRFKTFHAVASIKLMNFENLTFSAVNEGLKHKDEISALGFFEDGNKNKMDP